MFDLDREVSAWSAAVYAQRCNPAASAAELSDHLYCEIERARESGLSDEAAFRQAIVRIGTPTELTAEHAKNRSALGAVCQVAAKLDGPAWTNPDQRRIMLTHAVIWATLMIASSIVLKTTGTSPSSGWLLIVVFIPLWSASEQLLRRALRKRPTRGM